MSDTPTPEPPPAPLARAWLPKRRLRRLRLGAPAGNDARLLAWIERVTLKPAEAARIVGACQKKVRAAPAPGPDDALGSEAERVADLVIGRFAARAALIGGSTALGGVFPGAGTLVSAIGGSAADALLCMKLQVDMCLCLAGVFGHDLAAPETRYLACLLAAGGTLEGSGLPSLPPADDTGAGDGADPESPETETARLASPEGVQVIRQVLKGAAVQAAKEMFKRLGTTFGRRAVAKAVPLGLGVLVGGGANFALTRYVGRQARQWFLLDLASRDAAAPGAPEEPG